jgi:hypothetical protein
LTLGLHNGSGKLCLLGKPPAAALAALDSCSELRVRSAATADAAAANAAQASNSSAAQGNEAHCRYVRTTTRLAHTAGNGYMVFKPAAGAVATLLTLQQPLLDAGYRCYVTVKFQAGHTGSIRDAIAVWLAPPGRRWGAVRLL